MNKSMRVAAFGLIFLATGVSALAGGASKQEKAAAQKAFGNLSTAKMLDCSGLPCVDVVAGEGKHLKLVIDTGNPTSFLNAKAAKALGLKEEPVQGSDGKAIPGLTSGVLQDVSLGSGSLGEVKVVIADLSEPMSKGTFPTADGTLAYGAFKNRVLQLDYRKQTVGYSSVLPEAQPCPAPECGKINLITFGKSGPPIVTTTGFTANGKPMQVQIDTMYSGTLLVYPTSAEKLGLKPQSESKKVRHFPFTDDGVDMVEAGGVSEGFGTKLLLRDAPVYFAGPKVHLPDGMFDGTVGTQLLAGHRVTMDFSGMNFWVD